MLEIRWFFQIRMRISGSHLCCVTLVFQIRILRILCSNLCFVTLVFQIRIFSAFFVHICASLRRFFRFGFAHFLLTFVLRYVSFSDSDWAFFAHNLYFVTLVFQIRTLSGICKRMLKMKIRKKYAVCKRK